MVTEIDYFQHALHLMMLKILYVYGMLCICFISDTQQDKERDKYEAEYMLQENGKAMYE